MNDASEPVDRVPVVMKFGGSSVADTDALRAVARRVVARAASEPVVVVVSAMGKTTNDLIASAHELCESPPSRELDMLLTTGERHSMSLLAMAIADCGHDVVSLTGSQCGIITDHRHGQARVIEVRPFRVWDELAAGRIVIVGGFQGVSYRRDVTTIGRGGSDTTAVALAAALGATCEIYSDVDGVYSADPNEITDARRIDELGYDEMQALSRAGARVLHAQAVQLAQQRGIAIYARRTDGTGGETVIRANPPPSRGVSAVACDDDVVLIRIHLAVPDGFVWPSALLGCLSAARMMFLSVDRSGARGIISRSRRADVSEALDRIGDAVAGLGAGVATVAAEDGLAMVSCVGSGLEERPELVDAAAKALAEGGLEVQGTYLDTHSLAFLVRGKHARAATEALHGALVTLA